MDNETTDYIIERAKVYGKNSPSAEDAFIEGAKCGYVLGRLYENSESSSKKAGETWPLKGEK